MQAKPFMAFIMITIAVALAGCADIVIYTGSRIYDAAKPRETAEADPPLTQTRAMADKGDAAAQVALALRYEQGRGTPKDDVEAAKWYRKAADQGHRFARIALAFMYATGSGVDQDIVQADMWYILAGSGEAVNSQSSYVDELEQRMTPEQIAEARRRAQEWKPS